VTDSVDRDHRQMRAPGGARVSNKANSLVAAFGLTRSRGSGVLSRMARAMQERQPVPERPAVRPCE
jgi:hypothetical protein